MAVKAVAKDISVSTKRVKPLLELIRGKKVDEALSILSFQPSPWARTVAKVVRSAAANAENNLMLDPDRLVIVRAYADTAGGLDRFQPHARGRVGRIFKRFSHITVEVDEEAS